MLTLNDIRGYIAGLGIADGRNIYIEKLNNKRDRSIGMYHQQESGSPAVALGDHGYSNYDIRRISLLIYWNKDVRISEQAACGSYEKLKDTSGLFIGDAPISCIILQVPEPVDMGTDDNGVYEYVIWLNSVHQRKWGVRGGRCSRRNISGTQ